MKKPSKFETTGDVGAGLRRMTVPQLTHELVQTNSAIQVLAEVMAKRAKAMHDLTLRAQAVAKEIDIRLQEFDHKTRRARVKKRSKR